MRDQFKKSSWLPLAIAMTVMIMVMIAGGYYVITSNVDKLIARNAENISQHWAEYFADNLDNIEAIAAGAAVTSQDLAFFEDAQQIGKIFRFKLFDPEGRLRLVSDQLDEEITNGPSLSDHNQKAILALKTGVPFTEVKDGTNKPNRPSLYAETYLPAYKDGKMIGIVL